MVGEEQNSMVGEEQWDIQSVSYDGKSIPSSVSTRNSTKEWKPVYSDFIMNDNCIVQLSGSFRITDYDF
jgi:hypothetical protein